MITQERSPVIIDPAKRKFQKFSLCRLLGTVFEPTQGMKVCVLIDLEDPKGVTDFKFLDDPSLTVQRYAYEVFYQGLHGGVMEELGMHGGDFYAYRISGGSNLDLQDEAVCSDGRGMSLEEDIFEVAAPWFSLEGNPVDTLRESLTGLVRVCYEQGPILRAVSDASTIDERLENVWSAFLNQFDDAVTANIEAQQHEGVIQPFSARPAAVALNRMDAYMLVNAFGRHPRHNPELVLEAISRIWISTLYQSPQVTNEEQ